ncbi:MAG: DUF4091 domain-containing protein [Acutalibacter sp.]|nr:DUF4091 domain-containing protein [Acutalibacter sp.]
MGAIKLYQCSSLEKIFPSEKREPHSCVQVSALRGEEVAYQILLRREGWGKEEIHWNVESPLSPHIEVFQVKNVPCELAAYPDQHDDDYLTVDSGLFPDLLSPLTENTLEISGFLNTVLWINITVPEDFPAGEYPVRFTAEGKEGKAESTFALKVIPARLPDQKLLFTQWFYADCLAEQYHVPVYSERHWEIIEAYLKEAARNGINTILTPILTPPLDTAVGTERLCVQLVEIEKQGNTYRFDLSRAKRFAELALSCGITHFEINHLFTQWGAEYTPAVYAAENGEKKRIFGWDVKATSPEYTEFLRQLLPEVTALFRDMGLEDRLLFHVSDEPNKKNLEQYGKARKMIEELTGDCPVADALSDPDFYDRGLVQYPIAATDHIEPFLERKIPNLWAYYCCAQGVDVGNRFFSMPSYRNRILGLQLYKYKISGFLHWGYNFWHRQESRGVINPYQVTDAGGGLPGGDAFSVYPGEDGRPLPSIRLKVFLHGLQDLRALELLESLTDRETVERTVEGFSNITFSRYPRNSAYLPEVREVINQKIEEIVKERG